ncbi:hypothetical protein QFZ42_004173 [Variovorax paradoxus]|jgi:hypothetical protein|uniref:hypothetical protein n=1 Tax=Variovorax paradoxus TaxID=34073 RepID=UPI0027937704|nr:hypothetical protein [Variovorax paradoxus]MDQ0572339.1 hypothetical protein [Variovorax paradoxus]
MNFGIKTAALACTAPLALAGCSYLAPLLPDYTPTAPAAPPPVVSPSGLAPITEEQVERIREAIVAKPPTPAVAKVVRSAAPAIESFVRTEGCITARNGAVLNPFAAPGRLFDGTGFQGGPMAEMQYHDKTACVTVKRIQNWKMVSPKLLRFDVVYVGDDGEERSVKRHELMRQPKGGWLFTR